MLSLGGLNVAISLVLAMFLKSDVFLGAPFSVPGVPGWAPRVALEVWGAPWGSPGRSECCYFVGFRWFSERSCFLMFFDECSEAMSFSRRRRTVKWLYCFWEVKMLLFHWLYVCFSRHTFSAGAFLMNSFQDFNGNLYAVVWRKTSNQWKCFCENDISGFLCFSECSELKKCEKAIKFH